MPNFNLDNLFAAAKAYLVKYSLLRHVQEPPVATAARCLADKNGNIVMEADGATPAVTLGGAQTLTNKTLKADTTLIVDPSDITKALAFLLSGAATAFKVTLAFVQTAARTITFPDATTTLVGRDTTDTLTNKTLTSPTITGAITDTIKFCSTQFDAVTGTTGATLTNIVGLTGFSLVAGATYAFEIELSGVSTTNCGIKLGFKFTTATLTSLESKAVAQAAASVALVHSTTATDAATLIGTNAAAWLGVRLTGRIVVNAAGTLAIQAAQNAAHADTTSVFVGSWAKFTRTA